MSFSSILKTIGSDVKRVFTWIGSPAGQTTITTAGAVVEAVDPGLTGIVTLAETWIKNAFTVEALATAAASQHGTGVQKAAAVMQQVMPAVLQYAKSAGLPNPDAAQIQNANNAIVAFLNSFGQPA